MARKPANEGKAKAARPQGATTGYEAELWAMADALRGSMDAVEYKHVVLGLVFLKYISDALEKRHATVLAEWGEEVAEDRDEYLAENIFWVPPEARWANLKAQAHQTTIGQLVDAHATGNENRGKARGDTSICGQKSNYTTCTLKQKEHTIVGSRHLVTVYDKLLPKLISSEIHSREVLKIAEAIL